MKYIRTKDNQFITLCANEKEWATLPKSQKGGLSYKEWFDLITKNDNILKQANTIDKLCDTFVIIVDKQGYLIIDDYKKAMEIMQRNDNYNAICYGAIWTNKGLIYVAKVNDKGELELL